MKDQITSLPSLACFRVAAELESFSGAANQLNLTHGAVSRAVRLLEDDLGVLLFERRNRSVFLTDAGRALSRAVVHGFDHIEAAIRGIRAEHEAVVLTVSCEPTLMMRWLIPRMPAFKALHPNVEVRLVSGGGPVSLGEGINLAIRRNDFSWPQSYTAMSLFDEWIGVVCRPDLADAFFKQGHLSVDAPLLHSRTRLEAWHDWAKLKGEVLSGQPSQEFEHFYFSLQAAVAGLGAAIGPWHLVRDDLETGILCAPSGFMRDGSEYVLLSSGPLSAAGAAFQSWLCNTGLGAMPSLD